MLTTDYTDFRDELASAASLSSLVGELINDRPINSELRLSNRSANALSEVLTFLERTIDEADMRLERAGQEALAHRDAAAEYRRGRTEGFALGAAGATIIPGQDERAIVEKWMRVGYSIAKMSVYLNGDLSPEQRQCMEESVHVFAETWFAGTEKQNAAPDTDQGGPVPRLTEEDFDADRGDKVPMETPEAICATN